VSLKGKVCVVTGSSRSIGRAIAIALAREGCNVTINYNKSKDAAFEVQKEVSKYGVESLVIQADVGIYEDAKRLIEKTVEKFGRIDILVNNAGVFKYGFIQDISPEEWDFMIRVNLTSVYNCTHAAIKYMINQRSGKIINITSVYGIVGYAFPWHHEIGVSHYAAAKAGIIGFTKALAKELGQYNISVVAIAPGATMTDNWKQTPEELIKRIEKVIPLGRFATPEEIAKVVVFAAKNDYLSGSVIVASGALI